MAERPNELERVSLEVPDHILFRELDGEGVLLNLQTGEYYGLNRIGAEVWRALSARQSVDKIHAKLLDRYEVSAERLWGDLEALIHEMNAKGLVTVGAAVVERS